MMAVPIKSKVILIILLLLMVSSLLFAVLIFSRRNTIYVWDTDKKRLGALSVAIAMYEKALTLDPNMTSARENLKKLKGKP